LGDKSFVKQIEKRLGIRSKGRKILEDEDNYQLRDRQTRYGDETQNLFYWDLGGNELTGHDIS
jgi:hypothetical protein